MDSKILFLGTGGDIFVVGKQLRSAGGIIICHEGLQFHIDPGPGTLASAKSLGINLRENTAVFVTKNELLRANDINAVIATMTHEGLDKTGVLVCPPSLLSQKGEKDPFLNKFYAGCIEKIMSTELTSKLGIGSVDAELLRQGDEFSVKFTTPIFSLGIIPDADYREEMVEFFADVDILILSVPDPRIIKRDGHMNSETAESLISKIKPQIAVITGFGIKMMQSDPLYEAREMQRNTGIQVISAKEGMSLNPISFITATRNR
ncbi:MAG: hypothetical protein HGA85_02685 [Nanoarchaeota archaeon]|nr:hypothetical protein [Nanoarchaeota archaeon]